MRTPETIAGIVGLLHGARTVVQGVGGARFCHPVAQHLFDPGPYGECIQAFDRFAHWHQIRIAYGVCAHGILCWMDVSATGPVS